MDNYELVETGIYQNEQGRLRVRATATDPLTGKIKEKQRTLKAGQSIEQARQVLDALKAKIGSVEAEAPAPQRMTLRDYSQRWLEAGAARLAKATVTKHVLTLSHHILPELGDYYCDALTREDVQAWVLAAESKRKEDGELYGKGSVETWWRVLQELLRDMVADLQLPHDPTARVKSPKLKRAPRKERQTLTRQQLGELLEVVKDTPRCAEVTMMALTGMRPGEVYGLQWGDIDFDGERIHIRRSSSKSGEIVEGGKTGVGREPYMHPLIAERLRAHKKQLISNGARGWGEEDWVFPSTVGTPRRAGSMRKAMSTLSEMLELDFNITPSVLRRTFNTLLEAANVDKLVLWSQLGHSSDAMTKHYSYVHHDRKKEGVLRVFDPAELGT